MPVPNRNDLGRVPLLAAAAVLLAVAFLAACTSAPRPGSVSTRPDQAAPVQPSTARRDEPPPSTSAPVSSDAPVDVATRWLIAYRSATWTDGTPAAWIDRVRPYVTDAMNTNNEVLRTGGGGTDWAEFVRQHCTSTVSNTNAVIPPESPGTDTVANVQVTGTIRTTCAAGSPASQTEQASATLVIVKTARGWRVDQRLF